MTKAPRIERTVDLESKTFTISVNGGTPFTRPMKPQEEAIAARIQTSRANNASNFERQCCYNAQEELQRGSLEEAARWLNQKPSYTLPVVNFIQRPIQA